MEVDIKGAHRKSKAPWQSSKIVNKVGNPYAGINTLAKASNEGSLTLPNSNPYGSTAETASRRHNRRLTIHASAAAAMGQIKGRKQDNLNPPALPPIMQASNSIKGDSSLSNGRKDVETEIKTHLANASATEVEDYFEVLEKQQTTVTRNIKENINENQKNILELTNDLEDIQEELLSLRLSTKSLYGVLNQFKEGAERRLELESVSSSNGNDTLQRESKPRSRRDRSSVYALEKMWANELQSLYKHVDGASKFVQPLPGRHILAESGRWYEVNVASWKLSKAAHLFLLSDMLMVAMKSSNSTREKSSKLRLQAVMCWPLAEVELSTISSNLKDKDRNFEKTYTINLKTQKSSYVYSTDRYDHYLKIVESFRKAKDEYQRKEWAESSKSLLGTPDLSEAEEEKKQLVDSLRNSVAPGSPSDDSLKRRSGSNRQSADILLQDISARVHSRNRSHDLGTETKLSKYAYNDKSNYFNELKTIEDRLDEVDIEISHSKYTESVGLIKYIENKMSNIEKNLIEDKSATVEEVRLLIDVIKLKITNRKATIEQNLAFELQYGIERFSETEIGSVIQLFDSFGELDRGVSLYIQSMASFLSTMVSRLVVEMQGSTKGDVVQYLSNLIVVNVTVMKRAIMTYQNQINPIIRKSRNNMEDSSSLVSWIIEEFTNVSQVINRHLQDALLISNDKEMLNDKEKDTNKRLLQEFVQVLSSQLSILRSVGITVDYMFDDLLCL